MSATAPLRSFVLTVSIGAWVVGLAFDVAATTSGEPEVFVKGAFWLIVAGVAGAVVGGLLGLVELASTSRTAPAFGPVLTRWTLHHAVLSLFAISLALRRDHLDAADATVPAVIVSAVALVLLGATKRLSATSATTGLGAHERVRPEAYLYN
jgi:uncharacterized membrane protein